MDFVDITHICIYIYISACRLTDILSIKTFQNVPNTINSNVNTKISQNITLFGKISKYSVKQFLLGYCLVNISKDSQKIVLRQVSSVYYSTVKFAE